MLQQTRSRFSAWQFVSLMPFASSSPLTHFLPKAHPQQTRMRRCERREGGRRRRRRKITNKQTDKQQSGEGEREIGGVTLFLCECIVTIPLLLLRLLLHFGLCQVPNERAVLIRCHPMGWWHVILHDTDNNAHQQQQPTSAMPHHAMPRHAMPWWKGLREINQQSTYAHVHSLIFICWCPFTFVPTTYCAFIRKKNWTQLNKWNVLFELWWKLGILRTCKRNKKREI